MTIYFSGAQLATTIRVNTRTGIAIIAAAIPFGASEASAVHVVLEFSATIQSVQTQPFAGPELQAGITGVTGRLFYDTSLVSRPDDFEVNTETFDVFQPGGLELRIGNSIILASRYHLVAINQVIGAAGPGDYLVSIADTQFGEPATVNGVLFDSIGHILLNFRNADGTLFPDNQSLVSLPSHELFTAKLTNFVGSFSLGPAGVAGFGNTVPEPTTSVLAVSGGLTLFLQRRRSRSPRKNS